MMMQSQQHGVWREDITKALNTYSQDVETLREELMVGEDAITANRPSRKLLYKVEQQIRDAKHVIRRCRNDHVWMPALVQEPVAVSGDIPLNLHSLDARHRYEKALQRQKRRIDRYERMKHALREHIPSDREE